MMRNSILNDRHIALGSTLAEGEPWNDMPLAWAYHTDVFDEVVAVRTRAGLFDVSALNIVNVDGPDAESIIDQLVCIDITKLMPGSSRLSAEVDENGALCDDIMVIRDSQNSFRLSHGSGITPAQLAKLAAGKQVTISPDLDVHILSLQGPKSIDILSPHLDFNLATLPYFKHIKTTIFGCDVYLARGGYSGEQGYEFYCAAKDAGLIWDNILEAGKPWGILPASWNTLEITRIEAALLFFPFEMPEGDTTPWEINMGWGVDLDKQGDYIGKQAVLASRGNERIKQAGLIIDYPGKAVETGATITKDGHEIGVITSAGFSQYLMLSLGMAHLKPEYLAPGTLVQVHSKEGVFKGRVSPTPFYDPMRLRTHPEKIA